MIKVILLAGLVVIGLITILLVGGLVFRAYCQNKNAADLKIDSPDGINESMFVSIGGIEQWIQMRGENRNNPVLLILHGGPGFSYLPFTSNFRPWEKDFTVVQWDQRGAGKTFGKNGKTGNEAMTIDQMVQDGLEVVEFVRKYLKKDKVILLAHSWGTILGIPMITKKPDLFSAYIGTGQIVNMPRNELLSYELLLKRVREIPDEKAVKQLEEIGQPPYEDIKTWMIKGRAAVMYAPPSAAGGKLPNVFAAALTAPGYSLKDGYDLFAAFDFSCKALFREMMTYDATRFGTKFKVPILFIQGDNDFQAPASLVEEYFSTIEAPGKELVVLKGEGHTAVIALPEVFLHEMLTKIRPLMTK